MAYQPIYALCFSCRLLENWNIFATLAAGLLAIIVYEALKKHGRRAEIVGWAAAAAIALAAQTAHLDYGWFGVGLIFTAHLFFEQTGGLLLAWAALNFGYSTPYLPQVANECVSLLAVPLLYCYSGAKGALGKWFFYGFYCIHLPVLALLARLL